MNFTFDYFNNLSEIEKNKIIKDNYLFFNEIVKDKLSEYRYRHSLGVAEYAKELAENIGYPANIAYIAGILHDITKEIPDEETINILNKYELSKALEPMPILHAYTAYYYLKEVTDLDEEILKAIYHHSLGDADDTLSKIIYIADKQEKNRKWYDPKIFELASKDLDAAFNLTKKEVLKRVNNKGTI